MLSASAVVETEFSEADAARAAVAIRSLILGCSGFTSGTGFRGGGADLGGAALPAFEVVAAPDFGAAL